MQDHWCTPGAFSIPPRDLDPGKAQLPLLQKLPAVVGQLSLTLHLPGLSSAVGLLPRPAVDDRIAQAQAAAVPRVRRRAADVPDLPPRTPGGRLPAQRLPGSFLAPHLIPSTLGVLFRCSVMIANPRGIRKPLAYVDFP